MGLHQAYADLMSEKYALAEERDELRARIGEWAVKAAALERQLETAQGLLREANGGCDKTLFENRRCGECWDCRRRAFLAPPADSACVQCANGAGVCSKHQPPAQAPVEPCQHCKNAHDPYVSCPDKPDPSSRDVWGAIRRIERQQERDGELLLHLGQTGALQADVARLSAKVAAIRGELDGDETGLHAKVAALSRRVERIGNIVEEMPAAPPAPVVVPDQYRITPALGGLHGAPLNKPETAPVAVPVGAPHVPACKQIHNGPCPIAKPETAGPGPHAFECSRFAVQCADDRCLCRSCNRPSADTVHTTTKGAG